MAKKKPRPRSSTNPAVSRAAASDATLPQNVIPVPALPRPQRNTRIDVTLVPGVSSDADPANLSPPPPGGPGPYGISFLLCVPGKDPLRVDLDLATLMQSGESLLEMPPGVNNVEITVAASTPVQFFSRADGGVMSAVTLRIHAQNFEEAQRLAYGYVMPILSYWSYIHDVAIDVTAYEIVEEQTQVIKYSVGVVGAVKPFQAHARYVSTPEHRRLFAAYREALNATNIFYRVLSFYKVTEGIAALRTRRHRAAGNTGRPTGDPGEKIPSDVAQIAVDQWSLAAFLPHVDQPFDSVLQSYGEVIRNAVAHLDPHRDVLDADRYEDVGACSRAEPVLAYIARQMLDSEMRLLEANLPDVP